ncbi:MAG: alpha/beta hydrolase [Mycobacteriaceae bacterium]|nr:alpha/beta hydrolase [Mycobacteriaceae bacterium]
MLDSIESRHDAATAAAEAAIAGDTADAMRARLRRNDVGLRQLSEFCRCVAAQLDESAEAIELEKLTVIATGLLLLAELVKDAWLFYFGGSAMALTDIAIARATVTVAFERLMAMLRVQGARAAFRRAAAIPGIRALAIGSGLGGGLGGVSVYSAQLWQQRVLHHRDRIDMSIVADAAASGAVGGGVAGAVGMALAPGLHRMAGRFGGTAASTMNRAGAHAVSVGVLGAAGGVAGAIAGSAATAVVHGGKVSGHDLRMAVISGIGGGFVGAATAGVAATRTASHALPGPGDYRAALTPPGRPGHPPERNPVSSDILAESPVAEGLPSTRAVVDGIGAESAPPGGQPGGGEATTLPRGSAAARIDEPTSRLNTMRGDGARSEPTCRTEEYDRELRTLETGEVGPGASPGPVELAIRARVEDRYQQWAEHVRAEVAEYTHHRRIDDATGPRLDMMLREMIRRRPPWLTGDSPTADIEVQISALRWTDQIAMAEVRSGVTPEDGVSAADIESYRGQVDAEFADAAGWTTNDVPLEPPEHRARRRQQAHAHGHAAALPEQQVRVVAEGPDTADLAAMSSLHAARMPDGRTVHFRVAGDPYGYPVLLSPGTPVGVDGVLPSERFLVDRGFCLIVVERPGYGHSDPLPGRSVADCARDISYIAAELFAFDRYTVIGRSGGGSVAIAAGAIDPTHVERVVTVVGQSPVIGGVGAWTAQMGDSNKKAFLQGVSHMAERTRHNGEWLLEHNASSYHRPDHMWVGTHRRELVRGYERGLRAGVEQSWIADVRQQKEPWGVSFAGYRVPVDIVHGADDGTGIRDEFVPTSHSRINAALIGAPAHLHLIPGVAHMAGLDLAPVLNRYVAGERDAYLDSATWIPEERRRAIRAQAAAPLEMPRWASWPHGRWNEGPRPETEVRNGPAS